MADPLTASARSELMRRVKNKNTAPELALRHALWTAGVRGWRLHPRDIPGRPDLVFRRVKLAVFVDGAFWHGHPDHYHGQSGPFWDAKIATNIARDERVNAELADAGWKVLRFWDFEIERDPESCVAAVRTVAKKSTETRELAVSYEAGRPRREGQTPVPTTARQPIQR